MVFHGLGAGVGAGDSGRRLQGRILVQNRLLEPLERDARLDAELADERLPCLAVGAERVGLAAGAVKRQHELAA